MHRFKRGRLLGLEFDVLSDGIIGLSIVRLVQQNQAIGIQINAGLRAAAQTDLESTAER